MTQYTVLFTAYFEPIAQCKIIIHLRKTAHFQHISPQQSQNTQTSKNPSNLTVEGFLSGDPSETWTPDTLIKRQLRYVFFCFARIHLDHIS